MSADTKELQKPEAAPEIDQTKKVTKCSGCGKTPDKLRGVQKTMEESPEYTNPDDVIRAEEPTLQEDGQFYCTDCFTAMGCPRWAYARNFTNLE